MEGLTSHAFCFKMAFPASVPPPTKYFTSDNQKLARARLSNVINGLAAPVSE